MALTKVKKEDHACYAERQRENRTGKGTQVSPVSKETRKRVDAGRGTERAKQGNAKCTCPGQGPQPK